MVGRAGAVLVVLVVAVAGTGLAAAGVVPDTDSTVTRITLAENGTATWEVQVRTRLDGDAEVTEYEAFQEQFRENTSAFVDPFRDSMRGVVADAANATGRPMTASGFGAETTVQTVPRRWGVVTYEFRWTAFATSEGDALVVGDVFRGRFFLTENDTLAVVAPDGYGVAAVEPEPDARETDTVRWFGQRGFPDDTPAVRFEPRTGATATPSATSPAPGCATMSGGTATERAPGTTTAAGDSPGSSLPLAGAVLVVGLLAVGAYRVYLHPRRRGGDASSGAVPASDAPDPSDGSAAGATDDGGVPAGDETAGETALSDGTADGSSADEPGESGPDVDPGPVLTDADRVESVLAEAGGQIRQSEIVEALDWSKSKTSRMLSDMAQEGRVEKLRIGRENVIDLVEEFDDEG